MHILTLLVDSLYKMFQFDESISISNHGRAKMFWEARAQIGKGMQGWLDHVYAS